jgi:cyclopropane fatty-acyl-phospholipid synthase-like methyltransferase
MSYILNGTSEAKRLDTQTSMDKFSLEQELKNIRLKNGSRVLDAGCGSGVLCRYIKSKYPQALVSGCDLSLSSLEYAKQNQELLQTCFFQHDFVNHPFDEEYDFIFSIRQDDFKSNKI